MPGAPPPPSAVPEGLLLPVPRTALVPSPEAPRARSLPDLPGAPGLNIVRIRSLGPWVVWFLIFFPRRCEAKQKSSSGGKFAFLVKRKTVSQQELVSDNFLQKTAQGALFKLIVEMKLVAVSPILCYFLVHGS